MKSLTSENTAKATIMVIDDTPENLNLMATILTNEGYRPVVFPDGDMAIKAAKSIKPDLILVDIMMPGLDGFEVCNILKADKELSHIPVLFLSALNNVQNKIKAFSCGALDYITKPFHDKEVIARISTHLELYKAQEELKENKKNLEKKIEKRTLDLVHAQKLLGLGNWKYDHLTDTLTWSDLTYDMFGIPRNSKIDLEVYFKCVWPDDLEMAKKKWNDFVNGNGNVDYRLELRIRHKNTYKWLLTVADFQYNENGETVAIIGSVIDISEKKMMLLDLEKKNEILKQFAWEQSHALRALITRLMALTSLAQDEDFSELSLEVLLTSMNETINEMDDVIYTISKNLNK
jgi:DNA-binding response OmpR family regulator